MFDQSMYANILNAAYHILRNNSDRLSREFCEGFMTDHDPSRGQGSMRNAQAFYDYVAAEAQRQNGSLTIRSDDQLGQIVGNYIGEIHRLWSQRQQGGFGGGFNSGMGGFGSRPMGSVFNNGGSQLNFGQPKPMISSYRTNDVIEPVGSQPPQTQSPPTTGAQAPMTFSTSTPPQGGQTMTKFVTNPLDEIPAQGIEFNQSPAPTSWGYDLPNDTSVKMSSRYVLRSPDNKYCITVCDGIDQTYYSDPMNVINDFIKTVPESFAAEHFIFRVVYNHVEKLDVPTKLMVKVAKDLIKGLSNEETPLVEVLKSTLDPLPHGYHNVIVKYLLERINKGLHTSWRYQTNPSFVLKMTEIEDIPYLLGTEARLAILNEPNAKHNLLAIIRTSVLNAVHGYSKIMFEDKENPDFETIKQSDIFPSSIKGVYPSKSVIPPQNGSEGFDLFISKFEEVELSKRTYIRQIRSVIFTNVLGEKILTTIGKDPTPVTGQIPSLLSVYIPSYLDSKTVDRSRVSEFDSKEVKINYSEYLADQENIDDNVLHKFDGIGAPKIPVDQTLVAFQFKVKPQDYMVTMDLCTTLSPSRGPTDVLLAQKHLPVLAPTN